MEKQVRAHAVISGRVQGVFFRAETQRAAEGFGVLGWVRNSRMLMPRLIGAGKGRGWPVWIRSM
jgi:acylphosphatase